MRIKKLSSWKLRIEASALFVWFLSVVWCLVTICLLIYLWVLAEFVISQVVVVITCLMIIFIFWSLSKLRIPTTISTYDKIEDAFKLERKWIWTSQSVEYPLSAIKDVQVIQKGRYGKNSLYYRIEVVIDSGDCIALSSGNYRLEKRVRWIAKELTDFLAID